MPRARSTGRRLIRNKKIRKEKMNGKVCPHGGRIILNKRPSESEENMN